MILHDALEDLHEAINLVAQVLVPDHLDQLEEADWDLLVTLRAMHRIIGELALNVASRNRAIIENAWVGATPGAPLRLLSPLESEG